MSTDPNKQLVRRLFEDYINHDRLDRLGEIVAPTFVSGAPEPGPAAFATVIGRLRAALPDLAYTVDELVGEGDRVAVRWTLRGTFTGQFRSYPPTGKPVANTGCGVFEIADGKLVRATIETDRLGFLIQVGAVDPAVAGPPARAAGTGN
jgi:predicted ester cyclase